MQIGADQGALLTLLTRLVGARRAVEVGTFTGYSSICIARGLAPGGTPAVLRRQRGVHRHRPRGVGRRRPHRRHRAAHRAGHRDAAGAAARADRSTSCSSTPTRAATPSYFDELVPRVRPNGLLLVDNTLWSGRVVDDAATDDDTVAIKAFNDKVAADDRVESYLLPVGDGVTLIRKQ